MVFGRVGESVISVSLIAGVADGWERESSMTISRDVGRGVGAESSFLFESLASCWNSCLIPADLWPPLPQALGPFSLQCLRAPLLKVKVPFQYLDLRPSTGMPRYGGVRHKKTPVHFQAPATFGLETTAYLAALMTDLV